MSDFLLDMNKWANELESRVRDVRAAAKRHDEEQNAESFSAVRLAIAYLKPVVKVMKFTLKTSNMMLGRVRTIGNSADAA